MKRYNKKIEITRVFKHYILEWEDMDKERDHNQSLVSWIDVQTNGTEVYDNKEELMKRIVGLLG